MKCPYCGEEILDEAKKCKHCGEWLNGEPDGGKKADSGDEASNEEESEDFTPEEKKKMRGCLFQILLAVLVLVMFFTCSKKEKHVDAMSDSIAEALADAASEDPTILLSLGLAGALLDDSDLDLMDSLIESKISDAVDYHKYFIFSLSTLEFADEPFVGLGLFGKVWIIR